MPLLGKVALQERWLVLDGVLQDSREVVILTVSTWREEMTWILEGAVRYYRCQYRRLNYPECRKFSYDCFCTLQPWPDFKNVGSNKAAFGPK